MVAVLGKSFFRFVCRTVAEIVVTLGTRASVTEPVEHPFRVCSAKNLPTTMLGADQRTRIARPRRRFLLMILRPLRVDIRLRKPTARIFFLRLILWG